MKQIEVLAGMMAKQLDAIKNADNNEEKAELLGMAVGFITGLKLSRVITKEEYEEEYAKLEDFAYRKAV